MKEIAIFDLDGTLMDLTIDRGDFETCRASWASYLTARGVPTTLKPIWPELQKVIHTPLGRSIQADILKSLDELELAGRYGCLGRVEAVLRTVKATFKKLVLVTHNGLAFWERLTREHLWPHLFDVVITRDDMAWFKPDLQACESVLRDFAASPSFSECWVVGNSDVDRGLGLNLRRRYTRLVVRTFMIDPACTVETSLQNPLDIDITSVDALLEMQGSIEV
jgi:FMN phosphatase YigB (HAD superfamily)